MRTHTTSNLFSINMVNTFWSHFNRLWNTFVKWFMNSLYSTEQQSKRRKNNTINLSLLLCTWEKTHNLILRLFIFFFHHKSHILFVFTFRLFACLSPSRKYLLGTLLPLAYRLCVRTKCFLCEQFLISNL